MALSSIRCDGTYLNKLLEEMWFTDPELAEEIQTYIDENTYLEECKQDVIDYLLMAEAECGDGNCEITANSFRIAVNYL